MKVTADRLVRPSEDELELLKKIEDVYGLDDGSLFESLVRAALAEDLQRGRVKVGGLDVEERDSGLNLRGSYYLLKDNELPPEDRREIFRRLCSKSPAESIEVELPGGQVVTAQLVEQTDWQRLMRGIVAAVRKLLGCDHGGPTHGKHERTSNSDLAL
ncbi:hypothetical protein [Pseudomonas oryziphila]|uniref:Uncharacterized protein n=1 Tax=Pseudomonas oryziphila TaxID=2894079 RepID=A0ABM7CUA6_9PSED|nr:hypothetical protein [Pseudomonas oryziphila]AZL75031.1 hypothetical protein EI693_18915 [Pseudomonas oryziphila]